LVANSDPRGVCGEHGDYTMGSGVLRGGRDRLGWSFSIREVTEKPKLYAVDRLTATKTLSRPRPGSQNIERQPIFAVA